MTHKHIFRRFGRLLLSTLLSLSLTATSLTPIFATEGEASLQSEQAQPFGEEILSEQNPSCADENSENASVMQEEPGLISEAEPFGNQFSVSENATDEEQTPSPETETASEQTPNIITITFYDADGQSILFGPVEKNLSELRFEPDKGRYLFDSINESGASVAAPDAINQLPCIHTGKQITRWMRISTNYPWKYTTFNEAKARIKQNESFHAVYSANDYSYDLEYNPDGGVFDEESEEERPSQFTVSSEPLILPTPYKKGYTFTGWEISNPSAGNAYGSVINNIPTGTYIDYTYGDLQNDVFTGYQLKAKWEPIVIPSPVLSSVRNTKKGEVSVAITPGANENSPVSYELCYSTSASFAKNKTHVADLGSKTSYKLTNMPKGKTYYFKVRACKRDQKNEKVYSASSDTVSLKIKNGVTETSKITGKSAKLNASNVRIDGDRNLYVKATVSKRLKSYDDFYYLVSVDPNTDKILKSVASADKNKTVIFKTPVRTDDGINLINGKYALAVKTSKKKYKQISAAFFIKNPEAAADYTAPYPVTASKKGIQGSTNTDLGVQQSFTNFSINSIFANSSSGTKYIYNGKTYYFYEPSGLMNFASQCNSAGITCSVQIMMNWPGSGKYSSLLFGTKTASAPANLYAMNASTTKSRELLEAAFSFLADRCSGEDCHVDNWILGNEVNIYRQWYYAGNTGKDAFMKNYANSFRILYNSVKGRNKNAHIFICTDHTWINRSGDWGAKPFMESFNAQIKSMNKNIQWNLAYHAYPSILYIPTTWKDSYAPNSTDADFVSPKNLNILTDYLKKTYGKNTRIIISECGFTSAEGEANQAAALAYSFYKAQFDDMIDAFIIRTETDAPGEKLTKLNGTVIDANFGLCTASGKKRASYNVFKYMDTPKYEQYTKDCLKTIGTSGWNSVIPGFDDKKLKALPNR